MKIQTNVETIEAIQQVMNQQNDRPKTVRLFMAGFG